MRYINRISTCLVAAALAVSAGCQSRHEQGVKSNLRTQWTDVAADTRSTTEAAEEVLRDQGLKDVTSDSTNVDGTATGKKADGTKVTVKVQKKTESTSQVSVNVGTLGDPRLGAEIANRVKSRTDTGSMSR